MDETDRFEALDVYHQKTLKTDFFLDYLTLVWKHALQLFWRHFYETSTSFFSFFFFGETT